MRSLPFLPLPTQSRRFPPDPLQLVPAQECEECEECDLDTIGKPQDQYSIAYTNAVSACWRVLFRNSVPRSKSAAFRAAATKVRKNKRHLLGPTGHIERANAWTHLLGGVGFAVFAVLRPLLEFDTQTSSGVLSQAVAIATAATFFVSTSYHVFSTVRQLQPWLRSLDHGIIYLSLAIAATADTAVVTLNFTATPWQTVFDVLVAAVLLLGFFTYRRLVLDPEDTEIAWGSCALGLFRVSQSDFEFGGLRTAGYLAISTEFLLLLPVAAKNLEFDSAVILVSCNSAGLLFLILGIVLDNVVLAPDTKFDKDGKLRLLGVPLVCSRRSDDACGCGCVLNSHAWWHLLCVLSVVVQTCGREVVIARLQS